MERNPTAEKRNARAGQLRELVELQSKETETDEFGNEIGADWVTQFTTAARLMPLFGGETVMAGRMQGAQPYVCTIRSSDAARAVTTDWRVVDARAGNDSEGKPKRVFGITSITNPDEQNALLDLLVVEGERT